MTSTVRGDLASFLSGTKPTRGNPPSADPSTPEGAADLVARFMRPRRPNEGAVWAAAKRLPPGSSGAALWEGLVTEGVLPVAWADDPRRAFASNVRSPYGTEASSSTDLFADIAQVPRLTAAAALAADPGGVALAEDLVRECCVRLAVFAPKWHEIHDAVASSVVAWAVTDPSAVLPMPMSNVLPFVGSLLSALRHDSDLSVRDDVSMRDVLAERSAYTRAAMEDALRDVREIDPALARNVTNIASFCGQFRALRAMKKRAPPSWGALRGTPFAELPNPWEPLLDLYRQGYALYGFLTESGWIPLLLCPRFTLNSTPPPRPTSAP